MLLVKNAFPSNSFAFTLILGLVMAIMTSQIDPNVQAYQFN